VTQKTESQKFRDQKKEYEKLLKQANDRAKVAENKIESKNQEIEGHKQAIKNLEIEKDKISKAMVGFTPGQENRVSKKNMLQCLQVSGLNRAQILQVITNSHSKDAAAKVDKILPKDFKPYVDPKNEAEKKRLEDIRQKAIKAADEEMVKKIKAKG
jgi:hypothetical protein